MDRQRATRFVDIYSTLQNILQYLTFSWIYDFQASPSHIHIVNNQILPIYQLKFINMLDLS